MVYIGKDPSNENFSVAWCQPIGLMQVGGKGGRGVHTLSAALRQDGPGSEATIKSRPGRQKETYIRKKGRRKTGRKVKHT